MLAQVSPSSPDVTAPGFWSTPAPWIIIAAIVVIAVVIILAVRRNRSKALQERFGPEYDRTISQTGSRSSAEAELLQRERRVQSYELRDLPPNARDRYIDEWQTIQAQFVDDPSGAVIAADRVVQNVMQDRGYPVRDFDQRVADLSVEHGSDVAQYRTANIIAKESERGRATTEDLRQAMTQFRALFESLVGVDAVGTLEQRKGA